MNSTARAFPKSTGSTLLSRLVPLLGVTLLAGAAVSIYLWSSSRLAGPGFPLDDAWIHQTYARNLANWGQWSYLKDQPSAGSTSPLWSLALALGYMLKINPLAWAYGLGGLGLVCAALAGESLFRRLSGGEKAARGRVPWAGLFLAGEYHLVWAAASGMETIWYAALVLLVLGQVCAGQGRRWGLIGLLVGLGAWVRPDAVTLLGPVLWVIVLGSPDWKSRLRALGWMAAGFAVGFVPYLLFNLQIQGTLWPNTFYAKQAEYAEMRSAPLLVRFVEQLKLPLVGGGLFLLPGFMYLIVRVVTRRQWAGLGAAIWFLGFAAIYAERLPVTYQYGRYLMPAMPVYFVLGISGLAALSEAWKGRAAWVVSRVWLLSLVGVWLAFYGVVAGYYARDVAIIQSEMVDTAKWLAENTEPGALLAVHDIGAVGYFSDRQIVDLAGLISPDVIPIIRDEDALASWLDAQGVDYLVTLDGWYTRLPQGKEPVYTSTGRVVQEAGGKNMIVYRWKE